MPGKVVAEIKMILGAIVFIQMAGLIIWKGAFL